jgi:hypothetical protein
LSGGKKEKKKKDPLSKGDNDIGVESPKTISTKSIQFAATRGISNNSVDRRDEKERSHQQQQEKRASSTTTRQFDSSYY